MNGIEFYKWYNEEATEQDKQLHDRLYDFEEYFADMLFEKDTVADSITRYHVEDLEGNDCGEESAIIPDELRCFSFDQIKTKCEDMPDNIAGSYDCKKRLLTVSTKAIHDDAVILHEMIHMYEDVLNRQPIFYHDALLWLLYTDLREKISDLDTILNKHTHIAVGQSIYTKGGLHDVLFLLKSYNLDLWMGYPIGTVFRYRDYAKKE